MFVRSLPSASIVATRLVVPAKATNTSLAAPGDQSGSSSNPEPPGIAVRPPPVGVMVWVPRPPVWVAVKAILEAPMADVVEKVVSIEQFVRGGLSSPSRAHSWKW
jgi:hypothetical protein